MLFFSTVVSMALILWSDRTGVGNRQGNEGESWFQLNLQKFEGRVSLQGWRSTGDYLALKGSCSCPVKAVLWSLCTLSYLGQRTEINIFVFWVVWPHSCKSTVTTAQLDFRPFPKSGDFLPAGITSYYYLHVLQTTGPSFLLLQVSKVKFFDRPLR